MEKYALLNAASEKHIRRLEEAFGERENLMGELFDSPEPHFLMVKLPSLLSKDGCRVYEFLIEYDIYNPSQGIYFGCKSLTLPGHRHSSNISKAFDDWNVVKPHVLRRLNNTFTNKDFSKRFLDTDNADRNTYWPFWIAAYPDEDLKSEILPALQIIKEAYKEMLDGRLQPSETGELKVKRRKVAEKEVSILSFSQDSFDRLQSAIVFNIRKVYSGKDFNTLKEQSLQRFSLFLQKAEGANLIIKDPSYEYAYKLSKELSAIDFYCMMQSLFTYISDSIGNSPIRIPWTALTQVFLNSDGTLFKPQIRTLTPSPRKQNHWKTKITDLLS